MGKIFKISLSILLLLGIILGVSYYYIDNKLHEKIIISQKKEVFIEKGSSLKKISQLLEEKGVIKNKNFFYFYARFKKVPLKSGFYIFQGEYTIYQIW
ncbi:MAG: endolytic transglycosylase MltG, partial [Aquificae bacterium]|nr:endolytic transglycosylase MltG [Aquificota bacterium]